MTLKGTASRMGVAEFLDWAEGQEGRWELVDGIPYAMAGAVRRHDRVVVNAIASIGMQLAGKPCEVFTAGMAVVTPAGNVRLPDLGVECGSPNDDDRTAKDPRLVVEVLSPSTRGFDMVVKIDEYKAIPGLHDILLIDPEEAQAQLWSREPGPGWTHDTAQGLDAVLTLPMLGLVLPLKTLYDRVQLPPKPRLVA